MKVAAGAGGIPVIAQVIISITKHTVALAVGLRVLLSYVVGLAVLFNLGEHAKTTLGWNQA